MWCANDEVFLSKTWIASIGRRIVRACLLQLKFSKFNVFQVPYVFAEFCACSFLWVLQEALWFTNLALKVLPTYVFGRFWCPV